MSKQEKERIFVCEECRHVFTEEQKLDGNDGGWGHPCKSSPRSKKPWRCESYLKPFVEESHGAD